jgi:hypothetical protein
VVDIGYVACQSESTAKPVVTAVPTGRVQGRRGRMRTRIVTVVLMLGLIFTAQAFAAAGNASSKQVYGTPAGKVQSVIKAAKGAVASKPAVKAANTLPFTGLDLGVMLAAGFVLVGTGFSLRRLTRKRPNA